jgi:hypothetical protein
MIETKEKIIEGCTYSVTQLPARRAIKLKARLIQQFGAVFGQFFNVIEGSSDEQKNSGISKAFELLSCHIQPDAFLDLIMEILTGVRKDGVELTPSTIDFEFAGDIGTLYQVVIFALEVNYANFFTLLGIGLQSKTDLPPMRETITKKIYTRI